MENTCTLNLSVFIYSNLRGLFAWFIWFFEFLNSIDLKILASFNIVFMYLIYTFHHSFASLYVSCYKEMIWFLVFKLVYMSLWLFFSVIFLNVTWPLQYMNASDLLYLISFHIWWEDSMAKWLGVSTTSLKNEKYCSLKFFSWLLMTININNLKRSPYSTLFKT